MKRTWIPRLAALFALTFVASVLHAAPTPGQQTAELYDAGDGNKMGYWLFLPEEYGKQPDKKWPVIVFLHGSGEVGDGTTQLGKVKVHGPPKIVENKKDFGFIVISPQSPAPEAGKRGIRWWEPKMVKGVLDEVLKSQKQADAKRVYLTGLSMGGFGTWATAAAYPDTFAAIAPICGGGNPAIAEKIKHLPIWVFHGDADKSVPIAASQKIVDALKAADAKQVEFTIYPGVAHDSWTQTYDNPKLYEWFLKHELKAK